MEEHMAGSPVQTIRSRAAKTGRLLMSIFIIGMLLASLFLIKADVSGSSMEPGFSDGDVCIAIRLACMPSRGDVVLVSDEANGRVLIKRVAALPGDRIEISDDGQVILNGMLIEEPYAAYGAGPYGPKFWTVPDGHIFVLGDNRGASQDSRSTRIGPVPVQDVIGKIFIHISGREAGGDG